MTDDELIKHATAFVEKLAQVYYFSDQMCACRTDDDIDAIRHYRQDRKIAQEIIIQLTDRIKKGA